MIMGDEEYTILTPEKHMTTRGMRGRPTSKVLSREDFSGTTERMEDNPCNEDGEPKELRF